MGGGWICGILALLIVGAASKILPMHHSDMLEIGEDEDETLADVVENYGFEIFGGFGYSNSLADIGVPVVYKENVNFHIVEEHESEIYATTEVEYHYTEKDIEIVEESESEIDETTEVEYHDTEKDIEIVEESESVIDETTEVEYHDTENNIEMEVIEKEEITTIDVSEYKEQIDELEVKDKFLETEESQTINDEMTNVEFDSDSVLLEDSIHPISKIKIEEPEASIEILEKEQNTKEIDIPEHDNLELNAEEDETDNLINTYFIYVSKEIEIDITEASQDAENETLNPGLSGSNHAVETLDVLMKEAEEMETNEEVVVIHAEKEINSSQSIASSKYFDATQFILCFATVFILL